MVTCGFLHITISCFRASADAGSTSLNIALKNKFGYFSPCEDFPDFASSSADNNSGSIIPPAYFEPVIDKH